MSATPEQIAAELDQLVNCLRGGSGMAKHYIDELRAAADLIRAQSKALTLITEMDGDQPARSAWDMVRIARAALEAKS